MGCVRNLHRVQARRMRPVSGKDGPLSRDSLRPVAIAGGSAGSGGGSILLGRDAFCLLQMALQGRHG